MRRFIAGIFWGFTQIFQTIFSVILCAWVVIVCCFNIKERDKIYEMIRGEKPNRGMGDE